MGRIKITLLSPDRQKCNCDLYNLSLCQLQFFVVQPLKHLHLQSGTEEVLSFIVYLAKSNANFRNIDQDMNRMTTNKITAHIDSTEIKFFDNVGERFPQFSLSVQT